MCHIRTLCIKNQSHISHCKYCQTIYLWHNNLLLNFTPEDFRQFRETMNQQEFYDCSLLFPDEEERVIIHAPWRNISFSFTQKEWNDLKGAMDEALLMHEVYDLIK